jgi:hypothetical protein
MSSYQSLCDHFNGGEQRHLVYENTIYGHGGGWKHFSLSGATVDQLLINDQLIKSGPTKIVSIVSPKVPLT